MKPKMQKAMQIKCLRRNDDAIKLIAGNPKKIFWYKAITWYLKYCWYTDGSIKFRLSGQREIE